MADKIFLPGALPPHHPTQVVRRALGMNAGRYTKLAMALKCKIGKLSEQLRVVEEELENIDHALQSINSGSMEWKH